MPMIQSFSPMKLDYYECTIGITNQWHLYYNKKATYSGFAKTGKLILRNR